jgi:hypothetical protein
MREAFDIIFTLIALVIAAAASHGFSDPVNAERVLVSNGYTEVKVGDASWFACGGDWHNTTFTAKAPSGSIVSGNVCSGMFFKNSTIRFN